MFLNPIITTFTRLTPDWIGIYSGDYLWPPQKLIPANGCLDLNPHSSKHNAGITAICWTEGQDSWLRLDNVCYVGFNRITWNYIIKGSQETLKAANEVHWHISIFLNLTNIPWICFERSFSEFYLSIWNQLGFNQRLQLFVQSSQPYLLFFGGRN